MVLANIDFHMRKHFSENYPQFGNSPSKMFASLVLGRKFLNNMGFKARQVISLSRAPNYFPAWGAHVSGWPFLHVVP
jgi:hypothetical protein